MARRRNVVNHKPSRTTSGVKGLSPSDLAWRRPAGILALLLVVSSSAPAQQPTPGERHYARGSLLLQKADWKGAAAEFNQAIAADPRNVHAYIGSGMALSRLGETAKAAEAFRQAISLEPRDPRTHYLLGRDLADSRRSRKLSNNCRPL